MSFAGAKRLLLFCPLASSLVSKWTEDTTVGVPLPYMAWPAFDDEMKIAGLLGGIDQVEKNPSNSPS